MKSVHALMDLRGRTALVTGGSGHLGSVMASALAECGASVALLDLDHAACASVAARLAGEHHVKVLPVAVELANEKAVRAVPAAVRDALGSLDILIHAAAFVGTSRLEGWAVPFEQQSVDTWRKALEVNLTAAFVLAQAAAPLMRETRHGSIIHVASIYGLVGPDWKLYEGTAHSNPAAYAASKGGLLQLTRWLATTLAPDIRVNAITPGGVFRGHQDPFLARYVERTPLRRMATEEDFKGAALYLASDLSAYVTGQNIVVDGGWTAW